MFIQPRSEGKSPGTRCYDHVSEGQEYTRVTGKKESACGDIFLITSTSFLSLNQNKGRDISIGQKISISFPSQLLMFNLKIVDFGGRYLHRS